MWCTTGAELSPAAEIAYTMSPLGWNAMPVLASVTDTVGRLRFSYDAQAHISRVADPTARSVMFTHDTLMDVLEQLGGEK